MKGLLIKDFKLMMNQRNYFIVILAIAMMMMFYSDDISFPLVYLSFVVSLFTLNTMNYDDFDNGYPFIFTLPISRKNYVIEKYSLGIILGCGSCLLATIVGAIVLGMRGNLIISDLLMMIIFNIIMIMIMQSIMIPFHLKFGGEKGRIALICVFGILAVVVAVINAISNEALTSSLMNLYHFLSTFTVMALILGMVVITIMILMISIKISTAIINKKEF